MKGRTRWVLIVLAGLMLLALPTAIRLLREGGAVPPASQRAAYTPPAIATPALAATPIPTATPQEAEARGGLPDAALPRGPVVVDLAHYSLIERAKFQPLAAALAPYGLDLRFWLPTVDTADIEQITDFPDLSAELEKQLAGASALVVISPFFLYTPDEVAVVERFLADGGRLLLISDPDVESDSASDTNQLATAFNVIFNQDYLYDTVANDANFTYFFQGDFTGEARDLAGSRIAFYGGRSIGGAVEPQVRSADTTLSSLRNGLTSFNTVVIGGATANGSAGRVLAMSDFDVMTDPFVARHDNRRMLDFVADFLAGAQRADGMADFPNFLAKEVALAIDNTQPVGALALGKAAELQRMLEASGRELRLAPTDVLSDAQAGVDLIYVAGYRALDDNPELLAGLDLRLVEEVVTPTVSAPAATVVSDSTPLPTPPAGAIPSEDEQPGEKATPVAPVAPPEVPPLGTPPAPQTTPTAPETPETPTEIPTPTPATQETAALTPALTPAATPEERAGGAPLSQAAAPTATVTVTATAAITGTTTPTLPETVEAAAATLSAATETATPTPAATPTATPTPTPQVRLLLERSDGLRLLADETLLYVRRGADPARAGAGSAAGGQMLAVLGNSEQAISAALTRLFNRDFAGCLVQTDLIICPYSPGSSGGSGGAAAPSPTADAAATPAADATPNGAPSPSAPPQNAATVLIVDDNIGADADEPSEAAIYLTTLATAGYTPDLWVAGEQGAPEGADLIPYAWVIWSDAGYAASGIDGDNLSVISEYINQGGRLTISSRMPFFGVGAKTPSVVRDIQVADEIPELVRGLPETPIVLTSETPVLSPLEENPDPGTGARTALMRGPASADAGAPVLILMTDAGFEEPKGARLLLFGLSMGWLPAEVSDQLIRNMAELMLAE